MTYDLKEIKQCVYFVNDESAWTIGTINDIKISKNGVTYHVAFVRLCRRISYFMCC